jgi:hypothetical protein
MTKGGYMDQIALAAYFATPINESKSSDKNISKLCGYCMNYGKVMIDGYAAPCPECEDEKEGEAP